MALGRLTQRSKASNNKWIIKVKKGDQDQIIKFKARLNARGFEQQEKGVDFNEVFSPVMRHNTLQTLLAHAAVHDCEIEQMDVRTAFLHRELLKKMCISTR
jgi:hypothetical protein